MIAASGYPSPCLASVAMDAGTPTLGPSHEAGSDQAGDERRSNLTDRSAIKIPSSIVASFAVIASREPFINRAKTVPATAPGYNPHSASPARGSVQSGLQ